MSTSIEDIATRAYSSIDSLPPGELGPAQEANFDCLALQNGVVGEGLVSAFASMTFEARDMAATIYANVSGGTVQDAISDIDLSARRRLNVGGSVEQIRDNRTLSSLSLSEYSKYEADKLRDLFSPYMQHSLEVMASRFYLGIASSLDQTGRITEITTWVFVAFYILTTFVYMSQMQLLQLPLRSAR